ncbi:MAG: flagellar assembly protein FliW [Paenibacillus sp.]|jgi:flagellar assembly factor FliW|nr:flagellar assembly protein FliW [Paenibacillus sp.]
MIVKTRDFGEIEAQEQDVYTFAGGLPGFEDKTKFILLQAGEDGSFYYLQSVEEEALSFILNDPFLFFPDYEVELTDSVKEELSIAEQGEVIVLTVVSVRERIADATVNLLAPVILSKSQKIGKQIILAGSGYSTKHRLMPEGEDATAAAALNGGE